MTITNNATEVFTVEDVEGLKALPEGTIILDVDEDRWKRTEDGYVSQWLGWDEYEDSTDEFTARHVAKYLPATIVNPVEVGLAPVPNPFKVGDRVFNNYCRDREDQTAAFSYWGGPGTVVGILETGFISVQRDGMQYPGGFRPSDLEPLSNYADWELELLGYDPDFGKPAKDETLPGEGVPVILTVEELNALPHGTFLSVGLDSGATGTLIDNGVDPRGVYRVNHIDADTAFNMTEHVLVALENGQPVFVHFIPA